MNNPFSPVNRVNYLQCKARRDWWEEEVKLRISEMGWVELFYSRRAELWRSWGAVQRDMGYRSYAEAQYERWMALYGDSVQSFSEARSRLGFHVISTDDQSI